MTRARHAALAALICTAISGAAFAQADPDYKTPRTTWGVPDFGGFWTNTSLTTMQRPAGAEKLVLDRRTRPSARAAQCLFSCGPRRSRLPPRLTPSPPSNCCLTAMPRAPTTASGWTPGRAMRW